MIKAVFVHAYWIEPRVALIGALTRRYCFVCVVCVWGLVLTRDTISEWEPQLVCAHWAGIAKAPAVASEALRVPNRTVKANTLLRGAKRLARSQLSWRTSSHAESSPPVQSPVLVVRRECASQVRDDEPTACTLASASVRSIPALNCDLGVSVQEPRYDLDCTPWAAAATDSVVRTEAASAPARYRASVQLCPVVGAQPNDPAALAAQRLARDRAASATALVPALEVWLYVSSGVQGPAVHFRVRQLSARAAVAPVGGPWGSAAGEEYAGTEARVAEAPLAVGGEGRGSHREVRGAEANAWACDRGVNHSEGGEGEQINREVPLDEVEGLREGADLVGRSVNLVELLEKERFIQTGGERRLWNAIEKITIVAFIHVAALH